MDLEDHIEHCDRLAHAGEPVRVTLNLTPQAWGAVRAHQIIYGEDLSETINDRLEHTEIEYVMEEVTERSPLSEPVLWMLLAFATFLGILVGVGLASWK